jgi:hypothetical protein
MHHRMRKFVLGITHLLLLGTLGLALFSGSWGLLLTTKLAAISGVWLVITGILLNRLLATYEDMSSRLQLLAPTLLGALLSLSVLVFGSLPLKLVALAEIAGWLYVILEFRKNRQNYTVYGHGPLPSDIWLNPPADAFAEGDLILTDGRMAARTRNSVGHVEIVIRDKAGKLRVFSAYMEKGVVIHTLRSFVAMELKMREHFIGLRLNVPFTEDQSARAIEIADRMLAANQAWKKEAVARRTRRVNALPVPASLKKRLMGVFPPTGYDWTGQYTGKIHENRWTCMGVVLDLLEELGIKTRKYGTGLLGLGTGLLNPLMPIRLLRDPAFRPLTLADKEVFDRAQAAKAAAKAKPASGEGGATASDGEQNKPSE